MIQITLTSKIKMLKTLIFKFNNKNNVRLLSNTSTTVDSKEIQQFQSFTTEWWDEFGPTKALHSMNKLRIPFIRDGLINTGIIKEEKRNTPKPLEDVS